MEDSRSWDHVHQFPCKGKERRHGRHCIFSMWRVGRGGKRGVIGDLKGSLSFGS